MTKSEIKATLAAAFPGVDFRVFIGSYARGTNETRPVIEVSYNFKKTRIEPVSVSAVVPMAKVWAVGKAAA